MFLKRHRRRLINLILILNELNYNTGINTAWLKLKKYFKLTDFLSLYVTAIVLHPI